MRPKKTILLVDTNHQALSVRRFMLKTRGYRVLAATSSADAMEILKGSLGGAIELLISELLMPEMDGNELVLRAKQSMPELKTMLVSRMLTDFAGASAADAFLPRGACSPVELLERVRLLLNRKRGPKKRQPMPLPAAPLASETEHAQPLCA